MTNFSTGHEAEKAAAKYLEVLGYKIVDLNWKTPVCEIDIIAEKNKITYFIEVKYRKNKSYGSGFDYITNKKLSQMQFAAKNWVNINNYEGDIELGAVEVSGDFEVSDFISHLD